MTACNVPDTVTEGAEACRTLATWRVRRTTGHVYLAACDAHLPAALDALTDLPRQPDTNPWALVFTQRLAAPGPRAGKCAPPREVRA